MDSYDNELFLLLMDDDLSFCPVIKAEKDNKENSDEAVRDDVRRIQS